MNVHFKGIFLFAEKIQSGHDKKFLLAFLLQTGYLVRKHTRRGGWGWGCGGAGLINILIVTRHLPSVASLTVLVEHVSYVELGVGISSEIRCRRHVSFCLVLSSILHSQCKKSYASVLALMMLWCHFRWMVGSKILKFLLLIKLKLC